MSTVPLLLTLALCTLLLLSLGGVHSFNNGAQDTTKTNELFPTSSIAHVEPVDAYVLYHGDNQHLHTAHAQRAFNTEQYEQHMKNAVNSFAASSQQTRENEGRKQLFPNQIDTIKFKAYSIDFRFDSLQLDHALFSPHSHTQAFAHTDGQTSQTRHTNILNSYTWHSDTDSSRFASFTLEGDGTVHAVIWWDGEIYEISHIQAHKPYMQPHVFQRMSAAATHNLVIHRLSDLTDLSARQCGAVKPDNVSDSLHLEDLTTPARKLLTLDKWTNCYSGDTTMHKMSIGIGIDFGFYRDIAGSSLTKAQSLAASAYSTMNLVYLQQTNMYLQINSVVVQQTTGGPAWNVAPTTSGTRCTVDISTTLNDFTSWRLSNQKTTNALWMQLSNCWPPAGTVGLAWVGVLCSSSNGAGVSSYSSNMWLTIAHETGHNFGASHTFQLGQGTTGGIMDYGDGKLNGEYQFNTQYSKTEMCTEINSVMTVTSFTPYCVAAYAPVCGNGVIEIGEDCDDTTACCNNCKLAAGAVCTTGNSNQCCTSTCQFAATSVQCNGNTGYCGFGKCTDSACNAYSNLAYCGLVNPCRQTCLYNGQYCTDSFSGLNLQIADGAVCNTSPYSKCVSGTCVQQSTVTTTYSWKSSNPTPATCDCTGTQTYTVQCVDSNNQVVASSLCTGSAPASTASCAIPSTCSIWSTGSWGTCSVNCGPGTQTRTVKCVQQTNPTVVVSSSLCTTAAPASSQTCNLATCPVAWVASSFSPCTVACGGGIQTRSVTCMQTQNGVQSAVTSTSCTTTKPATQQSCNTSPCPQYSYAYGSWSTCSSTCGNGTQTRSAICAASTAPTVAVNSSLCNGTPITSATCNTMKCPNLQWVISSAGWSACSVSCGTGQQTRVVQCCDIANDPNCLVPVTDNTCNQVRPLTLQSCNTNPCSVIIYTWYSGTLSACSASCNGGVSTRTVKCINQNDPTQVDVGDSLCVSSTTAGTKPASSLTCNAQGCPSYQWQTSDWSSCPACGQANQTRTVVCKEQISGSVVSNSMCSGSQPASIQLCPTAPPCGASANWLTSQWSYCSQVCAGGIRTRTVACVDSNNNPVNNSICTTSSSMPTTSSTCNTDACSTYWWTGPFNTCTQLCGFSGTQSRAVKCFRVTDDPNTATPLADTACTQSKPSTTVKCNINPCPSYVPSSDWSACSSRCDPGVQTRNVTCLRFDGVPVPISQCANAVMPPVKQVCIVIPCPHWHREDWSMCSKACGGGLQNRTIMCRMPHDSYYHGKIVDDESLCPPAGAGDSGDGTGMPGVPSGKPATFQYCNVDPCPAYYWQLSPPSECSASCGGGVSFSSLSCMSSVGSVVSNNLCFSTPPNTTFACNTQLCPLYQFQPDPWSNCSAYCGVGVNTRSVRCVNLHPMPDMHIPIENVDLSFCLDAGLPMPPTSMSCDAGQSICWGSSAAITGTKNGRCDANTNTCVCRKGYAQPDCSNTVPLLTVATNGKQFTKGIPLGEQLLISWNSNVTSASFVNIILLKDNGVVNSNTNSTWPVGEYLAMNVSNVGTYTWAVGSVIPNLEAGSGYRVRVWLSKLIYADSDLFSIADPCAYISCGTYGTCSNGVCNCISGYSGEFCSIGPCQRAKCDPLHSSCDNAKIVASVTPSSTVCTCTNNYSGAQCRTPPACANIQCANGGDLTNVLVLNGTCTAQCSCLNSWSLPNCQQCGITCLNGGVPDAACTTCTQCNEGWFGPTCECKYYTLTLTLNMTASSWINTASTVKHFKRTLAKDIMYAVSSITQFDTYAEVATLTPTDNQQLQATVKFSFKCSASSMESAAHQHHFESMQHNKLSSHAFKILAVSGESLNSLYTSLIPLLQDSDSLFFQGQVTSQLDLSQPIVAADPTQEDAVLQASVPQDCYVNQCAQHSPNNNPSSGSDDKNTIIIAVVVVGVVLLAVVFLFVWYLRTRAAQKSSANIGRMGGQEMTNRI